MSSSHVRNLYKICITIIKPLLNPYIPGTSDLQIDWRLKFKCSHWAAPLRAWGIGGRRHWWPMHGFPIYDLGSNCRLDPSLSKKCQEIESWWIMCDVPANSDQLFFRPGSYVVNMAYDFLWFPAGKVSKLPRKLCRLWLSKVSGARAAQTCAGGGRKVEAREFSSGEGTDQEPNERYARSLEGHWIQCDQLPEFAPRHPLPRHMKDPLLDPTLLQIPRLTSPASKQHQAAAFNDV